ncbi:hypothetical protein WR25_18079 [Diploscapter pachys]|uniref:Major sperm protein n=1 Tax=Diploscapter pachys TaxID=2018661 RepID=A0A2A2LKU2_9BILA|nr:hypothetical protein WR25_18079 [Diploscapter pachys]
MALANVVLNPSKSVTYMPTAMKQLAEVSIENNEATPIIFKWKSTRPGVYKMRPVYGIVRPNEKKTIRLIFKGLGGKQCPTKDHYTCVLAATTSSNVRPELVWKQHRCQTQMADSSMIKRVLKILFVGVNDGPDNTEDKEKMAALQKRRGLMDDVGGVRGPIVIALYDEGDDSASGDDDDENEQSAKKTGKGNSRIWGFKGRQNNYRLG